MNADDIFIHLLVEDENRDWTDRDLLSIIEALDPERHASITSARRDSFHDDDDAGTLSGFALSLCCASLVASSISNLMIAIPLFAVIALSPLYLERIRATIWR